VIELGWWPRFTLCILAVWRLTHLLAKEDGPADLVFRLRRRLGESEVGRAMDCFYCLSVWIALPFTFLLPGSWLDRSLGWLALSGAACLSEKLTEPPSKLARQNSEEVTDVLRSEKGDDGEAVERAANTFAGSRNSRP
jgi:hypothetical protein